MNGSWDGIPAAKPPHTREEGPRVLTLLDVETAIARLADLDDLRAILRQYEAQLRDRLPVTPYDAVEALRAHAIGCLDREEDFTFWHPDSGWTKASKSGPLWAIHGYPPGEGRFSTKCSEDHIRSQVLEAVAFPMNVPPK